MKLICGITNCGREHYAKGYCKAHYCRNWVKGNAFSEVPIGPCRKSKIDRLCKLPGCGKPHFARNLCQCHYNIVRFGQSAKGDQRSCSVPGCNFVHCQKGFCKFHNSMDLSNKYIDYMNNLGIDTNFGSAE